MPLDPHVKRFLHMVAAGGLPEVSDLTPAEMRQAILRLARAVDVKDIPIGKSREPRITRTRGSVADPHCIFRQRSTPANRPDLFISTAVPGFSVTSRRTKGFAGCSRTRAVAA